MYKVKTEKFEGPLDLLLELIEAEKLEITEISLSAITNKYLEEVSKLDPKTYDVAEFMIIAARLLYLKSKALLPSLENAEEEEEIEELKQKLEVYKKYREAAREFSNILNKNQRSFPPKKPNLNLRYFTPPRGVNLKDLWDIFTRLLTDLPEELKREEAVMPSEKITIEETIANLKELFRQKNKNNFQNVIGKAKTKIEAIVLFLAILELIKCNKLIIIQDNNKIELVGNWHGKQN